MIEKRIRPQFTYEDQRFLDEHMPPVQGEDQVIDPLSVAMEGIRKPSSVDPQSSALISDLVSAGLPALSSILAGSSPSIQNRQFQYADQYAKTRGQARVPSKANLMELANEEGEPYLELAEDSLGKTPYYQPKGTGGGAGGGARAFAPVIAKNIQDGSLTRATVTSEGLFDEFSGEKLGQDWYPFKKDELLREKTVQGGSIVQARNPLSGKLNTVTSKAGLGDLFGGLSKEEAAQAIKDAAKGKAATQKSTEAIAGAEKAITILDKPDLTPEEAATGIFSIIKAINGERLSDTDYANLRGQEFKTYARQVEDWVGGRLIGRISPRAIAAYRQIAKDMIIAKKKEAMSIKRGYTPKDSLPKEGQKRAERAGGIVEEQPTKKEDFKNKFKGFIR